MKKPKSLRFKLAEAYKTTRQLKADLKSAHDELQKTNSELLQFTIELDDRVASRTTELNQANEKLRYTLNKLRKITGGVIQAMTLTVERRDPYTAGHQRRVANLARTIATEMGLSKNQICGIRIAGVIHDVGKLALPAEILSKPGQLTEIELSLIKTHSINGYDILKTIEFDWPVAQIVFQHHEKMNGSGYPQGLSGKDIIIEARILGVADVVEAMSSHRPYRPALGTDKALREISQNKGIVYDSKVVDACIKVFTEKGFEFK